MLSGAVPCHVSPLLRVNRERTGVGEATATLTLPIQCPNRLPLAQPSGPCSRPFPIWVRHIHVGQIFVKCRQHCWEIWVSFVLSEARHERPWLGAPRPKLRDRSHPPGIVECSRADVDTGGISLRLRMRTHTANWAVIVNCLRSRRRRAIDALRSASDHRKALAGHRHSHAESSARPTLAVGAMAQVNKERTRAHLIADRSAKTAAGKRKLRSHEPYLRFGRSAYDVHGADFRPAFRRLLSGARRRATIASY